MNNQLLYLAQDIKASVGRLKYRYLYFWMSFSFLGILMYRIERSLFLLFGHSYKLIRILILPIVNLIRGLSNVDIHYQADIKGGMKILHHSMGVVISGRAIIDENLTLTGGNVIGIKSKLKNISYTIGKNCNLGANACIIGPLQLGDNIQVAACACVVKSHTESNSVLAGVPAKILKINK
jgi:serine acetyltransferase